MTVELIKKKVIEEPSERKYMERIAKRFDSSYDVSEPLKDSPTPTPIKPKKEIVEMVDEMLD